MSSGTLAFLLFSAFPLISLEVVAGSTTKDERKVDVAEETEGVDAVKAGRCIRGCCAWGARGCLRCCKAAEVAHEETKKVEEEVSPEARTCRYGCCVKGRYGCARCCSHRGPPTQGERSEAVGEVAKEVKPEVEEVLRCRYGCCMIGRFGCVRCCRPKNPPQAEEGVDAAVAAGESKAEQRLN